MSTFQLSQHTFNKLKAFRKIIEVILDSENIPQNDSELLELVVSVGLDHMLRDVLPKEEILLSTMTQMFNQNPNFVCEYVSKRIKAGGEEETDKGTLEARKLWGLYT